MKVVIEQDVGCAHIEDGGMARILEINSDEVALFVRIHSWGRDHSEMADLEGRRVRVTIETIED